MRPLTFDPHSDRIRQAQRRLLAAYERQDPPEVPVVEPAVGTPLTTTQETLGNLDLMLDHAVRWANNLAATDNDWSPVILGYCSVVMVPEAFGCEVVFIPGASPWARHALHDISGVYDLRPVKPREAPVIRRQFEWMEYAQRRLGTEVPMWTLDIQSPFSVAAQIVNPEELLTACITQPKAVHHLCRMVTDYTLDLMRELLGVIEHPGFPGANFPSVSENVGLCVADDTPLIMLSPAMYREFALPYNSELGAAFGGLHIHSCGNYAHNLDNLLEVTGVRSIQVHAGPGEFPLPESAEEDCPFNRARRRVTLFVDTNDVTRGDRYRGRYREHYAEYVVPRLAAGGWQGCILQSCGCPADADLDAIQAALTWTRDQAASTPTAS